MAAAGITRSEGIFGVQPSQIMSTGERFVKSGETIQNDAPVIAGRLLPGIVSLAGYPVHHLARMGPIRGFNDGKNLVRRVGSLESRTLSEDDAPFTVAAETLPEGKSTEIVLHMHSDEAALYTGTGIAYLRGDTFGIDTGSLALLGRGVRHGIRAMKGGIHALTIKFPQALDNDTHVVGPDAGSSWNEVLEKDLEPPEYIDKFGDKAPASKA